MKICMIGLGYIGLPTATLFASRKIDVVGVDVSQKVVNTINAGQIHIVEPELDILVHAAVSSGYLKATTSPQPADAFLIAVPTPFRPDRTADLSYVEAATISISKVLEPGNVVILESTSPVGTTDRILSILKKERPDLFPMDGKNRIYVAYCPERVLPGKVIHELVTNDRVIGGIDPESSEKATAVYKIFVEGECITTTARTAEMCKLTENSYRDVNIAFANELSLICDQLDINVWELIRLANRHPRVNILQPGPGVGGHCIAVDPWFIVESSPKYSKIIKDAREVNDFKPKWVNEKIKQIVEGFVLEYKREPKICVFGISFKPDIDDLRESPALSIALDVAMKYKGISIVEPNINDLPADFKGSDASLVLIQDLKTDIDIPIILVKHKQFDDLKGRLSKCKYLLDTVGLIGE